MSQAIKCFFCFAFISCLPHPALLAQQPYRVLPADFNADKTQQMMRSYLRRHVHKSLDRRLAILEAALQSNEKLEAYQKKRREFIRAAFGEMPSRTPLNALLTGVIKQDGFTIEKVLFESQPGFHVTANVYRPDGKGPFPAILHPVGHSQNGKAYAEYQRANRLFVQNGFLVLCYDPIGQGERKQLLDEKGMSRHRAGSEHHNLGVAPILLGRSLATYMVWDAVRALDYLCERNDVDSKHIGCTGNSGGGNLTSYLMAYDRRIVAAAPGCFMTTHRRKNESPGPGDAEQNLHAQIREGFDHPDFIISRAPKPTLILAATQDYVPIEGAWEAYRQAKRVYTKLGYPERVELVETNAKHGFSRRLREASVRFMVRWLQNRNVEIVEKESVSVLPDQALHVTPKEQVLLLGNARSMLDLFVDYERRLKKNRPELTRELVRKVAGFRPLNQIPDVRVKLIGDKSGDPKQPQKMVLTPEEGIVLPGLYWEKGNKPPILITPSKGMNSVVKDAMFLHEQGHPILIVDVRDVGETQTRNWRFFGADYQIAHMLGRSWVGMRAEDILTIARWLETKHGQPVEIHSDGDIAISAIHASAAEPRLIESVTTRDCLHSWREVMNKKDAHRYQHIAIQNALRFYDLPDLKELTKVNNDGK